MAEDLRVPAGQGLGDQAGAPLDDAGADEAAEGRMLLLVSTRRGVFGFPSEGIVEVLTAAPLARVPGAVPSVAGVVNRRGSMLTVVDLGQWLGSDPSTADPEHRVVVFEYLGREVGVAVDEVLKLAAEASDGGGTAAGRREPLPRVVELDSLLGPVFHPEG